MTSAESFGRQNVFPKICKSLVIYRFYCLALFHSKTRRHMINQGKIIFRDRNASVSICDHLKNKMCNCKLTLSTCKGKSIKIKRINAYVLDGTRESRVIKWDTGSYTRNQICFNHCPLWFALSVKPWKLMIYLLSKRLRDPPERFFGRLELESREC